MSIKNIPPHPGYILRFKRGTTSLLGGMRRHILSYPHDYESEPFSSPSISPWEWLMSCGPVGYYYTAISTAEGLMLQREEFINNLFQSSPRLSQYWATQFLVYEYCYRLFINFHGKLPSFLAPAMMTTCPASHHLCPAVTQLPTLPTIVITDVDGSQAGLYNALHETQDILRRGDGLLWREWTGKFSTPQKTEDLFFDGAPPMPEDQEDEVYTETGNSTVSTSLQVTPSGETNCPKQSFNDSQNPEWVWEEKRSDQVDTINEDNDLSNDNRVVDIRAIQDNAPKELEWWERDDSPEEEDEEDEEDSDEEGSDEEDSDEEDSDEEGSEGEYSEDDGDDEREDDSDDDPFEEGSDAEEDSNEISTYNLCSIASRVSATATTASLPCESKPQHAISIRAQTAVFRQCQIPQNLGQAGGLGAPLSSSPSSLCFSIGDSDLESSNSSTTISSIPTPTTPSSPSVTPIDPPDLRKSHQRGCSELPEASWLLMNSLDVALGAARRAELELELQSSPQ